MHTGDSKKNNIWHICSFFKLGFNWGEWFLYFVVVCHYFSLLFCYDIKLCHRLNINYSIAYLRHFVLMDLLNSMAQYSFYARILDGWAGTVSSVIETVHLTIWNVNDTLYVLLEHTICRNTEETCIYLMSITFKIHLTMDDWRIMTCEYTKFWERNFNPWRPPIF